MAFRILPALDLSACFTWFLLAPCFSLLRGFYLCVGHLNLNYPTRVYAFFFSEVPDVWILMVQETYLQSVQYPLPFVMIKNINWGSNKRSRAETNTLAVTSGLVFEPEHHLEMWMDSAACTVISAKNTSHTLRALYPCDMCSVAYLSSHS